MRKLVLAAAVASMLVPPTAAFADPPAWSNARRDHDRRDYDRDGYDRDGDRWSRDGRERQYRRGSYWNGDRYYADGRYDGRRLTRADRIYRANDGRYYCRRNDGTTGLIIGAAAGGLLGRALDGGRERTVGTILGLGAGALLGREIDRGEVRCR